ncbi:hypothetical protein [Altibacter sp. HG106]|uniref:hypothetical protein n=1 Tax=Altibacter sp. HG106 TaxID=3023937 RepID=UPI00234FF452|nr:hypothetical protein [Altibacter sp. HG106]MDC7994478.1 hypothetical protein [Altibacter sp. HG106]
MLKNLFRKKLDFHDQEILNPFGYEAGDFTKSRTYMNLVNGEEESHKRMLKQLSEKTFLGGIPIAETHAYGTKITRDFLFNNLKRGNRKFASTIRITVSIGDNSFTVNLKVMDIQPSSRVEQKDKCDVSQFRSFSELGFEIDTYFTVRK